MGKIRIYELARELNMTNTELVGKELGFGLEAPGLGRCQPLAGVLQSALGQCHRPPQPTRQRRVVGHHDQGGRFGKGLPSELVGRRQAVRVGALNDLGYLWVDQNKHLHRSLKMVEIASAAEPDNIAYRDSLGWAYYRLGRFEEAVRELKKAAEGEEGDEQADEQAGAGPGAGSTPIPAEPGDQPGSAGEAALSSWLDSGRCLLISAQDYYYNRGLTLEEAAERFRG